jgi:hypothetical protein
MLEAVVRLYLDLLRLQEEVVVVVLTILEHAADWVLVAGLVAAAVTTILD